MKIHSQNSNSERGIALLLVLAVIAILSIVILGLAEVSEFSMDDARQEKYRFQAKQLAESGAALAMHPDIEAGDPALRKDFGDGRAFEVRITTEGGRILVNSLTDDILNEAAKNLFIRWGVDASMAAIAAESIADWVDQDSNARNSGAEKDFYASLDFPEYPLNREITSLEEMLLIRGMDQVARINPRWREYFTIYSDGLIDLNAAPAETIEAIFSITPDVAIDFVAARNGNDGIVGTEDDYKFDSTNEVRSALGLSSEDWDRVSTKVTLDDTLRRIESTGMIGDFSYRLVVLAEIAGQGRDQEVTPVARFSE